MDRMKVSGTLDKGSIPFSATYIKNRNVLSFLFLFVIIPVPSGSRIFLLLRLLFT